MLDNSDCNLDTNKNVSTYCNSDSDSKTDDSVDADINKSECLL